MVLMDYGKRMLSFLKRRCKERKVSAWFLENGSNLLEGLACASNCAYDTPFRNYTAKEITSATSNFRELVMFDGTGCMFRGSFQHRLILVKRFRESVFRKRLPLYINRDIVISLTMCHHKNVLKFLGCCLDFEVPVLVYEYAGDARLLYDILYYRKEQTSSTHCGPFPWKIRLKVACDVANALVYLRTAFSTPIIHRDISAHNIIIDQFGVAKLLDFSLCIWLPPGESQVQEDILVGVNGHIEPEYVTTGIVTEKTDVYMFGVLLLILLTGKRSLDANYECFQLVDCVQCQIEDNCLNKILDNDIVVEKGETMDKQLLDVVELALRCTQPKGVDRPNIVDVAKELRNIERSSRIH
ncbi:hypothetical protein ACH5RR_022316 [Cinchona calisaya]|uniref:Protein kinase domain-containing protein n=1 Tax=Cinchona calisaya TaxID=153742 RepID=A0ABD2Z7G2_9GENT